MEMDKELLKIGSIVISSSQWIGYLPLIKSSSKKQSFSVNGSLNYRLGSLPWIWNILLILLLVIDIYIWSSYQPQLLETEITTETGEWAALLTGLSVTSNSLGQRLYGLIFGKSEESFWREMCEGIERISQSNISYRIDISKNSKYTKIFLNIKRSLRNMFLLYISIAIVHGIFDINLSILNNNIPIKSIICISPYWKAVFFTINSSWGFMCQIHSLGSLWLIFPIKLFTGCLKMISQEMSDIFRNSLNSSPEKSDTKSQIFLIKNPNFIQRHSELSKKENPTYNDQQKLNLCIENYYRVSELLSSYNSFFGNRLIVEMVYNSIVILGYIFMMFTFFRGGFIVRASQIALLTIPAFLILYNLGTNANNLSFETDLIFDYMCKLPHHLLSDELKEKVKFITLKMSSRPLSVEPGNYFTLNRRTIASILSVIMSSLIVLVQFRDGEAKKSNNEFKSARK